MYICASSSDMAASSGASVCSMEYIISIAAACLYSSSSSSKIPKTRSSPPEEAPSSIRASLSTWGIFTVPAYLSTYSLILFTVECVRVTVSLPFCFTRTSEPFRRTLLREPSSIPRYFILTTFPFSLCFLISSRRPFSSSLEAESISALRVICFMSLSRS